MDVNGKRYTAKNILLATGGRTFVPEIPGAELGIGRRAAVRRPLPAAAAAQAAPGRMLLVLLGLLRRLRVA